MKSKAILLLFALALVAPLVFGFTVTLQSPADNAVISGSSVVLNATIDSSGSNVLNCSFYAFSPSTANSSLSLLATATNDTADDTVFNTTFDSSILEDSNDYTFRVVCKNASYSGSDESTGVTIDNTVPDAPTSLSPSDQTIDNDGTVTFTATVTDSKTTGCTLHLGVDTYTMTYSGSTCTYTASNLPERVYDWYVTATDGTNSTNSATNQVIIDIKKGGSKYVKIINATTTTTVISEEQKNTLLIIAVVAIIAFIIIGATKKKVYYKG
ncbi:MAG: hypothetical protein ACTSR2_01595 [Candidatus Hodarchaeales archaeon]